jgi:ribosome maturation factor RimP
MRAQERLVELLEPVILGLGYEWVGIEFDSRLRILRVYIDSPTGITVDDCSKVSYQVSGVLDVEDPIPGRYQLEISSPGMERPLFRLDQFQRFIGRKVRLQLSRVVEGRRKWTGILVGVDGDDVLLEDGQAQVRLAFGLIEKARLAPEFDKSDFKGSRHGQ